jgi:hypothetical protein
MLGDAGVDPTDPLVLAKGVEGADDDTGSADRASVLGTGPLEHATTASEIKAEPASRYIFTSESARLYWRHKQQNASSGTREVRAATSESPGQWAESPGGQIGRPRTTRERPENRSGRRPLARHR